MGTRGWRGTQHTTRSAQRSRHESRKAHRVAMGSHYTTKGTPSQLMRVTVWEHLTQGWCMSSGEDTIAAQGRFGDNTASATGSMSFNVMRSQRTGWNQCIWTPGGTKGIEWGDTYSVQTVYCIWSLVFIIAHTVSIQNSRYNVGVKRHLRPPSIQPGDITECEPSTNSQST